MTVLLISATTMEQTQLRSALGQAVSQSVCGRAWAAGLYADRSVWLVETGLGPVNTAHALTRALEMEPPRFVLQVGVAGAYPDSGLQVGDLALAGEEHYGDLGVGTTTGWRPADEIGLPVARTEGGDLYNRFPVDPGLTAAARQVLDGAGLGPVACGPFVTVAECSGTDALGRERARRVPGALCESMEGAAAAHICALYGARLVEVRGISNQVADRDRSRWDLPRACAAAQAAAALLLREL